VEKFAKPQKQSSLDETNNAITINKINKKPSNNTCQHKQQHPEHVLLFCLESLPFV
jgi:hypothetical protein